MKIEKYDDKDKAEYGIYAEITDNTLFDDKIKDAYTNDIINDSVFIAVVIEIKENNSIILKDNCRYIVFNDFDNEKYNLKVGEYVYITDEDDDGIRKIIRIDIKLNSKNKEVKILSDLRNKIDTSDIYRRFSRFDRLKEFEGFIEDKEEIINEINENLVKEYTDLLELEFTNVLNNKKDIEQKEQEEKEKREQEYQEKYKDEIDKYKLGNKTNIETNNYYSKVSVENKDITINEITLRFNKRICDIMEFQELKDRINKIDNALYYSNFNIIDINTEKLDFEILKSKKSLCKVNYKDDNPYINNTRIRKSKFYTLLNNVTDFTDDEKIKAFNRLSIMKMDLLKLNSLRYEGIEIPLKIELIDDENFKLSICGHSKNIDWKMAKERFFHSNSSRSIQNYIYTRDLENLRILLEIDKKELFGFLNKISLLQSLKENADN